MGSKFYKHVLLGAFLFLSVAISAQITGTVTDAETGEGLIGANILIKGTSTGTVTDFDGNYSLDGVETGSVLVFSYTGYAENEITYDGTNNVIDLAMSAGEQLDEVVVIGYGTVKKSDVTGALVSLNEDDFNQGVLTSPDQLIQGRAAGVQLTNNSGQPGGQTTIRIRGISSLRGGNNPLFVIDGVPLSGISASPGGTTSDPTGGNSEGSNPFNFINPNDIANIQILKDASATAIYGSRGANGVVLITTKKGKTGDPVINFNTSIGISSIQNEYETLDGDGYRSALSDYGLSTGNFGSSVDAFDEILQTGITNNHNFTVSGGNENGNYRVGVGYLNQEGIIKGSDFTKLSTSLNGSYKFLENKRLRLDLQVLATSVDDERPFIETNNGFQGNLIAAALQWNPTHPLYNSDGTPFLQPEFGSTSLNPVNLISGFKDESRTTDILASISPSYEIIDGLTYKMVYSYANGEGNRLGFFRPTINLPLILDEGLAGSNRKSVTTQNLTHTLSLSTDLSEFVGLNAVVGYEYQKIEENGLDLYGRGFTAPPDFGNFAYILQNTEQSTRGINAYANPDAELQSYFGRVNFNFGERYLVTATVRHDGSSKFGENNKYGTFPSFAVAWNIHKEPFFNSTAFDNLKFRAGWGQVGNQEFPAGASQRQIRFEDDGQGTQNPENVANPDLKWESTTTYNFGLDFAFSNYRFSGSIEYFNATTNDLLFNLNAIPPAPDVTYWDNVDADIIQSGLEFSINAAIISQADFSWDVNLNTSFIKSEFDNYDGGTIETGQLFGQGISGSFAQRLGNGQPLYAWYLRRHIGIGEDGLSEFADNEQLSYTGTSPNPDVIAGLATSLNYKNWGLTLNFNGAFGHQIYNNTQNTVLSIGNLGTRNIASNLIGGSPLESTANAIKASDRYLEDGDYIKLSNATVSYNIGEVAKIFKGVRVYLTGQNLLTITDYSGFDPEVNTVNSNANGIPSFGIEYLPYPTSRTFILGASFNL